MDEASITAALAATRYIQDRAALSLALDVLRWRGPRHERRDPRLPGALDNPRPHARQRRLGAVCAGLVRAAPPARRLRHGAARGRRCRVWPALRRHARRGRPGNAWRACRPAAAARRSILPTLRPRLLRPGATFRRPGRRTGGRTRRRRRECLPAESYLDWGDRAFIAERASRATAARWQSTGTAPLRAFRLPRISACAASRVGAAVMASTGTVFTPGDLVVSIYGDGDGSGTYADNQASPIVLEQINPGTGAVDPITGVTNGTLTPSGALVLPQSSSTNSAGRHGERGSPASTAPRRKARCRCRRTVSRSLSRAMLSRPPPTTTQRPAAARTHTAIPPWPNRQVCRPA